MYDTVSTMRSAEVVLREAPPRLPSNVFAMVRQCVLHTQKCNINTSPGVATAVRKLHLLSSVQASEEVHALVSSVTLPAASAVPTNTIYVVSDAHERLKTVEETEVSATNGGTMTIAAGAAMTENGEYEKLR
uniref:Uncharacterized protein n=1 Tax=Lygus hesperus TaxID=30085 RepID=A0A146M1U9_LYGHE